MKQKEIMIGCAGAVVVILLMMGVVCNLDSPDDTKTFQAGISLSNNTGYDIEARIYIHGNSNWDVIHLNILNGTQKDIVVEWENDLTDVLVIYDIDGEARAFLHHLEPDEWRSILIL